MSSRVTRSSGRLRKEPPEDSTSEPVVTESQKKTQAKPSPSSSNDDKTKKITKRSESKEQRPESFTIPEKTPPLKRSSRSRLALKQVDVEQIIVPEKERVVVKRTPSMKDTFPGRLEWKKKHYDKPVTSTPVMSTKSCAPPNNTKDDVESCFGFDDSTDGDENYSILISPILKEKDKVRVEQRKNIVNFKRIPPMPSVTDPKFNFLLERYNHDEDDEDGELHVNLKGIKATYSNKHSRFGAGESEEKKRDRSPILKSKSGTSSASTKRTKKTKAGGSKKEDEDLDEWVEKKNKEFEDISKFPLVLEKSP